MSYQTESITIITTWVALLIFLPISRNFVKQRFLKGAPKFRISTASGQNNKPGSPLSQIGTLFVFIANIATFALVFTAAMTPASIQPLNWLSVHLPPWVSILGSILFVLNAVWGQLVLLFNPNYTPLFQPMRDQFLLATRGPYAVLRHPRYAAEAWLNMVLMIFTGFWLPLLGALGWIAMYHQARAEEEILLALAGDEYEEYRQRTGMFFPRRKGIR